MLWNLITKTFDVGDDFISEKLYDLDDQGNAVHVGLRDKGETTVALTIANEHTKEWQSGSYTTGLAEKGMSLLISRAHKVSAFCFRAP